MAIHNRLHVLRLLGRTAECAAGYEDFQRRFATDGEPAICAIVASARDTTVDHV